MRWLIPWLLLLLTACSVPHLAGTNDAALEYAAQGETAVSAPMAAIGIKSRLASALVPSDVEATDEGRVRVVVDADVAGGVDALLRWRGGIDVRRQAEPATTPPLLTLGIAPATIADIAPVEHGRALAVTLSAPARALLQEEQRAHPGERVTLSRGSVALETLAVEDTLAQPLVLRFGDDVLAYTKANRNKLLLRSPILPPLQRTSAGALPPRWGLAAASAILPFALSFGWLFFVRRFDRARPEPLWLVLATFALGGLAIVPAGLVEVGLSMLTPWLDPSVVTMGGQLWALPIAIAVTSLVVGGAEEGAKFLAAWSLARHRREFDEPVDGIVYGCAASLGFAAVENIKYFAFGRMSGVVIAVRALETVPAHMFFGAIWGWAMGRTLVSRKARVWPWLLLAMVAHGTFDALLSTDGAQPLATALTLVLAVAFVLMLRSALRHGAVPVPPARKAWEEQAPPPTEPLPASALARASWRVGSPVKFILSSSAMVTCAFALTLLGTVYELLQHRVNVVLIAIFTVMLALFALAAWGVSATIPLDVVVDAQGITFAGARTPWRAILRMTVEPRGARAAVRLETPEGVMRLGPTDARTAEAIVAAVQATRP
ncbi:MAG TPA: PrsW family intramembrane metalloprotease [Polyangiaceae bacterium]